MSKLSDEDLWSLVDREGVELRDYLDRYPGERGRVDELRDLISVLRDERPPLPERIGPFRIDGVLGEGGMGIVYRARQEHPPRDVALKVVRGVYGERGRAMFRREVAVLARLEHPSIARIYAAGETDARDPYFAMELIEGVPLDQWVEGRGLDRDAILELIVEVGRAVQFAHERGVVHRDLKPSNILVDADGRTHVLDFGLAAVRDPEVSMAMTVSQPGVIGTIGYMSPEQAAGRPVEVDARTDVYALGVILYQLVAGRLPLDLADRPLPEAIQVIRDKRPPPPSRHRRGVSRDLDVVVLTALEKDRSRRYADVAALLEDVDRLRRREPIAASAPSKWHRLWLFYRRHLAVLTLTSLLLAVSGAALVMLVIAPRYAQRIGGDWWSYKSPFDGLRWQGDQPIVLVDGRWYRLLEIDGFVADYVVGRCKQTERGHWRKRFSEDLLQVLNRMGSLCFRSVDLVLRDVETGERVRRDGVALSNARRKAIHRDRYAWPFDLQAQVDRVDVTFQDRTWRLVELEGVPVERLMEFGAMHESILYDVLCEVNGASPGPSVSFVLEDPATGEARWFTDVPRAAPRLTDDRVR